MSVTIRAATADDVPIIVDMALHFQDTTAYAHHLRATPSMMVRVVEQILTREDAGLWLADNGGDVCGMLAAALYVQPFSGESIGAEIVWWMNPDARGGRTAIRLLREAERWAKDRGATTFQMMAPVGKTGTILELGRLYEALHYEPIETHYQRRLM